MWHSLNPKSLHFVMFSLTCSGCESTSIDDSISTDIASRWIRYGLKTREEMIPIVEKHDGVLDQGTIEKFCDFTKMSNSEFYAILDKWYNTDLFEQDSDGVWHKKFKVGQ